MNATELKEQWENVGAVVTKSILSIGHNVPIDTASGCGSGYSYTDNTTGRCSARESAEAWGIATGSGDGDGDGDCSNCTTSSCCQDAGCTGYMYVWPSGNVCYLQDASTGWQVTTCSCWQ